MMVCVVIMYENFTYGSRSICCMGSWFSYCSMFVETMKQAIKMGCLKYINMSDGSLLCLLFNAGYFNADYQLMPTLEDLHTLHCIKKAQSILRDTTHPGHDLFKLLPSGRRYRTIRAKTNRLEDRFYPTAITTLNNQREKI